MKQYQSKDLTPMSLRSRWRQTVRTAAVVLIPAFFSGLLGASEALSAKARILNALRESVQSIQAVSMRANETATYPETEEAVLPQRGESKRVWALVEARSGRTLQKRLQFEWSGGQFRSRLENEVPRQEHWARIQRGYDNKRYWTFHPDNQELHVSNDSLRGDNAQPYFATPSILRPFAFVVNRHCTFEELNDPENWERLADTSWLEGDAEFAGRICQRLRIQDPDQQETQWVVYLDAENAHFPVGYEKLENDRLRLRFEVTDTAPIIDGYGEEILVAATSVLETWHLDRQEVVKRVRSEVDLNSLQLNAPMDSVHFRPPLGNVRHFIDEDDPSMSYSLAAQSLADLQATVEDELQSLGEPGKREVNSPQQGRIEIAERQDRLSLWPTLACLALVAIGCAFVGFRKSGARQ